MSGTDVSSVLSGNGASVHVGGIARAAGAVEVIHRGGPHEVEDVTLCVLKDEETVRDRRGLIPAVAIASSTIWYSPYAGATPPYGPDVIFCIPL